MPTHLKEIVEDYLKRSAQAAMDAIVKTVLTRAPGNDAPIGGLKVVTENGWFAARPSGTENIYKIYAESFGGADHLRRILEEAQTIVNDALAAAPQRSELANKINSEGIS